MVYIGAVFTEGCLTHAVVSEKSAEMWIVFKKIFLVYSILNISICLIIFDEDFKVFLLLFIWIDIILLVTVIECVKQLNHEQTRTQTIQGQDETFVALSNHIYTANDDKPPSYEEAMKNLV